MFISCKGHYKPCLNNTHITYCVGTVTCWNHKAVFRKTVCCNGVSQKALGRMKSTPPWALLWDYSTFRVTPQLCLEVSGISPSEVHTQGNARLRSATFYKGAKGLCLWTCPRASSLPNVKSRTKAGPQCAAAFIFHFSERKPRTIT